MPSVRTTTASRSPQAAHRSSENQYGPIMFHALESVRRTLILAGATEGLEGGTPGPWPLRPWRLPLVELRNSSSLSRFLPTSRHRSLRLLRLRPAAIALEATALRQREPTPASPGSVTAEGHSLETLG